jgi:hypothetical protein
MRTVVETWAYIRQAHAEGMSAAEREAAVAMIAANPEVGDLIVGSGGCRKVRVAGRGRGKSGGYRVITYFVDDRYPAFLLAVLFKGSRANFSKAEVTGLAAVAKTLAESLGPLAVGSDIRRSR